MEIEVDQAAHWSKHGSTLVPLSSCTRLCTAAADSSQGFQDSALVSMFKLPALIESLGTLPDTLTPHQSRSLYRMIGDLKETDPNNTLQASSRKRISTARTRLGSPNWLKNGTKADDRVKAGWTAVDHAVSETLRGIADVGLDCEATMREVEGRPRELSSTPTEPLRAVEQACQESPLCFNFFSWLRLQCKTEGCGCSGQSGRGKPASSLSCATATSSGKPEDV